MYDQILGFSSGSVPHKALLPNALRLPAACDGFFFCGHKPTLRFGMVALGFCHTK
jgi:hypothetical protein